MSMSAARAMAGIATGDDRFALTLLLAPFLIVALSLGAERTARQLVVNAPQFIAAAQPLSAGLRALPEAAPPPLPARQERMAALSPPLPASRDRAPTPSLAPPARQIEPLTLRPLGLLVEPPPPPLPSRALLEEPAPASLPSLALLVEPAPVLLPSLAPLKEAKPEPSICIAGLPPAADMTPIAPRDPALFGRALSTAARAQLRDLVIYNPKYVHISYPMGDVPPLFGVCTDVIVRAYRALGIDLQALIQETGSGRGDRNIDHRRVEVVRRFLGKYGASLPITDLAEDYQPGDIVTYYRPQNRGSTSHIAIVTDQLAPSGRPMIVHNRGWGPELEDALFVDMITGHYRFTGITNSAKSELGPQKRRVARHQMQGKG
jgi:uncharacterized protein YijF (DUF1287 family)